MNRIGCENCCTIPPGPGPECMCECHDGECYGQTVGGGRCELPYGHYPASHHRITWTEPRRGFMEWTDEAMAEFARIDAERND